MSWSDLWPVLDRVGMGAVVVLLALDRWFHKQQATDTGFTRQFEELERFRIERAAYTLSEFKRLEADVAQNHAKATARTTELDVMHSQLDDRVDAVDKRLVKLEAWLERRPMKQSP